MLGAGIGLAATGPVAGAALAGAAGAAAFAGSRRAAALEAPLAARDVLPHAMVAASSHAIEAKPKSEATPAAALAEAVEAKTEVAAVEPAAKVVAGGAVLRLRLQLLPSGSCNDHDAVRLHITWL